MLAMLVFLVMLLYALCSLRSSSGLRCSALWPVWTRRTIREFGALFVACARLVFLVLLLALCSLLLSAGPFLKRQVSWSRQCRRWCSSWTSSLARRCATTGAGVGPDSVQLLDKIVGMPVVGLHGSDSPTVRGDCSSWTRLWLGGCGAVVQTVQDTVWRCRSCSSSKVVDIPVFTQWLIPVVLFRKPRGSPVR